MVTASGDYSIHTGDPDRLVEWDRIEQVVRTVTMCVCMCVCVCVCAYMYTISVCLCGVCMFSPL